MVYFQPYIGPEFVAPQSMSVASLVSIYPASIDVVGKYAKVNDLWGSVEEIMRCSYDGTNYYWRPQRTDYSVNNSMTNGSLTLFPLATPPSIYMTGTLIGNVTITPSTTNVWPGCRFEVMSPSSLGLNTITFTGLVGGVVTALLGGSSRILEYTSAGWKGK